MPRFFLEVAYDGTAFHGSQVQGDIPTVQLALNIALSTILREPVETFGASRTDEGVHALCNFYHFDTGLEMDPRLLYRLNAVLPPALAINHIYTAANPELNARFDALNRSYRYRIYRQKNPFLDKRALYYPYKMDEALLHQTASIIAETTNFESFAKRKGQTRTYICAIKESYWLRVGDEWQYVVVANRFLRGMVRALVATQLKVARSNIDLEAFRGIIAARDCTKAFFNVTGHGLYLEKIEYPEGALTPVGGR